MSNSSKLRALVVSPTPTWPLNYGNRKRIFSVCSKLKQLGFEIHFVHYASEGDWRDYIPTETRRKMDSQWDIIDHVWPSKPLHDWPKEGEDHKIDEWWDWSLENHLSKTFAAREYDLCLVNYTWLSKALTLAPKQTYKVLDTHDKFSGRRQLLANQGIDKEFFHTTEEQEVLALNRADLVWAIKQEEAVDFINMGTTAKVAALLHIDEKRESTNPEFNNGTLFGFIGANNNINRVNISRFIERTTPIFTKYCAPITINIAGSICNDIEITDNPFFKSVGYVNSIDEFYDGIHAAIIPMEFSTGLKIKVAEALSHTKPMLAHEHAMEGFTPCHEYHKFESFEKMAVKMVELGYDNRELEALKVASSESHQSTENAISQELIELKECIIKQKTTFVLIPQQYGNPKALAHYIAQAKIDVINWNFDNAMFIILGGPNQARPHPSFIRFMSEHELEEALEYFKPNLLISLIEKFPSIKLLDDLKVVSLCKIEHLKEARYIKYNSYCTADDELYFPSIGHINIEKPEFNSKVDEVWIIGDKINDVSKKLLNLVSIGLVKKNVSLNTLKDIDNTITKSNALPRTIFVNKQESDLNYSEQIFLEIAEKYAIEIRNIYQPQLLFQKRNNVVGDYEHQFFPAWERFINNTLLGTSLTILD
ncbi:glycosyltransferase [uncultured Paraglaciecola sp.]|uniref:glycosyltransferase n=1 Tax=uncultured Paraglaciecola sp. TaxID=1765024 RepID=UPI002597AE73|nr:glycosyltransferase [uncultured Paraglaciecola sp.]